MYEKMISMASFDLFYTDDWFPLIFSFTDDAPHSDGFEAANMESTYTIMNLGTLFVIFLFGLLQYVLYAIAKMLQKCCSCRENSCTKKLKRDLFWGLPMNFIYQSYFEVAFALLLNYERSIDWDTPSCFLNNAVFFIFSLVYAVFPFLL